MNSRPEPSAPDKIIEENENKFKADKDRFRENYH